MVITVVWAELWFVDARCNLAESVGIVRILIRTNVGYFRYIKQERRDILIAFIACSTVVWRALQMGGFWRQETVSRTVGLMKKEYFVQIP